MRNIIGVRHVFDPSSLKQQAIMFDQIAISELDYFISDNIHNRQLVAEYEWLKKNDIIFNAVVNRNYSEINNSITGLFTALYKSATVHLWLDNPKLKTSEIKYFLNYHKQIGSLTDNQIKSIDLDKIKRFVKKTKPSNRKRISNEFKHKAFEYELRATGLYLEDNLELRVIPIVPNSEDFTSLENYKNDVIQVVIKSLPEPDENTPWKKIIDFKNDPDAKLKFARLMHWINKIGKAECNPLDELKDELEFLLSEYEDHLRFHKMKINSGIFETTISTIAGLLENSLKFKLKDMVTDLFVLKKRKIALMEAERKAPGREVAYISKARNFFQ